MHGVIDIRTRTAQYVTAHQLHDRSNGHDRAQSRYDPTELEFSDYGRDPRFLPGWWIIPMCFVALLSVWVCVVA
jgi:hypothetical protein